MPGSRGCTGHHRLCAGASADQVGDPLRGADGGCALLLEPLGPFGRVRGPASGDVAHAVPDDSVRDAPPDPVRDPQALLDEGVHQVVRQRGTASGAPHREDDTVVALHAGLHRAAVGHPLESDPHASDCEGRVNPFATRGYAR
jgi:hypothetical protein